MLLNSIVKGVFAAARAAAPAIIFMDEVDSIAAAREGGFATSGAGQQDNSSASGERNVLLQCFAGGDMHRDGVSFL